MQKNKFLKVKNGLLELLDRIIREIWTLKKKKKNRRRKKEGKKLERKKETNKRSIKDRINRDIWILFEQQEDYY